MREIKFRAWDKAQKVMTPTFDIFSAKSNPFGDRVIFGDPIYEPEKAKMFLLKDLEIIEFTGLHDKNGKEIYEGDILKGLVWGNDYPNAIGEVVFRDGSFVDSYWGSEIRNHLRITEIISNIYEHPELLRK
jgi:uncharacterized phage protein (TIGR01671 family)